MNIHFEMTFAFEGGRADDESKRVYGVGRGRLFKSLIGKVGGRESGEWALNASPVSLLCCQIINSNSNILLLPPKKEEQKKINFTFGPEKVSGCGMEINGKLIP